MATRYNGLVFANKRRTAQSNGTVKTHKMDPEFVAALGQGETVVFHGKVHTLDTNARSPTSTTRWVRPRWAWSSSCGRR